MKRTLEQALAAKGFTAQEITDLGPALTNARFRSSLEEELGLVDTLKEQNTKLASDLNSYDKWFTDELTPDYEKLRKEREDAAVENAGLKARMELIQKQGMRRQGQQQDPEAQAEADRIAREASDAERQRQQPQRKYVDEDTFKGAFEATGTAIASAVNLARQHEKLFGADAELDMEVLYAEAKTAKMPVKAYWEKKFHVAEKREEIAKKRAEDNETRIRLDERNKMSVEMGLGSNHETRNLMPSNNPFTNRKKSDGDKQPWERGETELAKSRLEKALTKAAARGEA